MHTDNIPPKPQAPSTPDERRWAHSALRRRLLTGQWEQDLEEELLRHLPTDRREALGPADLSSCPIEQVTRQLAMLYHTEPHVTGDGDISALVGRDGYVTKAGFFQLMQKVQQLTLGIREMFVRVDVAPHIPGAVARVPGLSFRTVSPDFVIASASEDAPDIPLYYQELRLRMHPETGTAIWVWDVLDIRNPNDALFGMYEATPAGGIGAEVSELFMGHPTMRGESYPYRSKEGIPFLPLVLYHAEKTGQLFNAFDASQLAYGSLVSAVLFSFYVHCVRDNSWPQKYVAGLSVSGLSQLEGDMTGRRSAISTDPSSILMFQTEPDMQGQPLIGSFTYADPEKLLESISKYEYRVATAAGISSEAMRMSGDPRSGYAISVSRSGQRESSARYSSIFRRHDQEMMEKCAMLANRFLGASLPESGYRVIYSPLGLSPEEMRAQREDIIQKLQAGLISPVDAMQIMNPDLDPIEAKQELERIRAERAQYSI
jgi:hypothetical protein